MFRNYFITAIRNFAKNKLVTFINIMGLATGLTCAFLVFLFVRYELSVDQFHHKIDRLYLLTVLGESRGDDRSLEYRLDIEEQVVPQLMQKYPEIRNYARLLVWPGKIDYNNQRIHEERFWFGDANIFEVMTLPLRRGNPKMALRDPNSVVITPEMAGKYFGEEDPIGKTVKIHMCRYPNFYTFKVTGILEPLPKSSSFKIDFLAYIPFNRLNRDRKRSWHDVVVNAWTITLIELADPSSYPDLSEKLSRIEYNDRYKRLSLKNLKYQIEPFKNFYLHSKATYFDKNTEPHLQDKAMRKSDMHLLIFLTVLGGVILVVSCINIINLTTARATLRAREIGVRKAVGARRPQLILQFITETVLLSCLSLPVALLLTEILLPVFNTLVNRELSANYVNNWGFLLGMVGITALTGFLSGIYPAFVLSAFKPSTALRSFYLQSSMLVRKGLMVLQIGLCVIVLISSMVMIDEMNALKVKDVGFNARNLIFFEVDDVDLAKRYPAIKKGILRIPGVTSMTASSFVPWQYGFMPSHAYSYNDATVRTKTFSADPSFRETYQIPLIDGEGFGNDPADTERLNMEGLIIINETARRLLQSNGADPLWQNIRMWHGWWNRVCGVMKDFYCFYPARRIEPVAILSSKLFPVARNHITIRLAGNNHSVALAEIKKTVKHFFPQAPFEYKYVAREMEKMHAERMGYRLSVLVFVTGFSFLIAAVGLFGFAVYETERCTKEIGIRKTLGAKRLQIAVHFILRFAKLTLMANLLAWPVCYFIIQRILRLVDYPHPVRIGFTHFLWAGILTLTLTVVVVWVQTLRAASIDPVKALRYE